MKTIELLYQVVRARSNLDAVGQGLKKGYRLALVGPPGRTSRLRGWLGPLTAAARQEVEPLRLEAPLDADSSEALAGVDAVIVHVGAQDPEASWLKEQAAWIPPGVATLWVQEEAPASGVGPGLPKVHPLKAGQEGEQLARLCLDSFPDLSMRLGRDLSGVRLECARRLIHGTASRMGLVAAASSVTLSVPVLGQLLGLLAVTGETLVITASQLRLCLLLGALYGRPLNVLDRADELWPVIGGGLGWRALARQLLGVIPGAGALAKGGVAFAGTWAVGETSRLLYELGEPPSEDLRRRLDEEARGRALEEARRLLSGLQEGAGQVEPRWADDSEAWERQALGEGPIESAEDPDPPGPPR